MKTSIGRIVNYVLPDTHQRAGEVVPALIVRVWNSECVQLKLFLDEVNDPEQEPTFASSAVYGSPDEKGAWHWPVIQS